MLSITTTAVDTTDTTDAGGWIVAIILLSIIGALGAYFFLLTLVAAPSHEITNVPLHTKPYIAKTITRP